MNAGPPCRLRRHLMSWVRLGASIMTEQNNPVSFANASNTEVLAIRDLRIHYSVREGFRRKTLAAVNGIDLSINAGECLGLVGESGCGKSTLAGAIMGLIPITSGSVHVAGQDVPTAVKSDPLAQARNVQMVFQDPFASLN